jgi:hypothetical protein
MADGVALVWQNLHKPVNHDFLSVLPCGSEVDVALVEIDGRQLQQEDAQAPVWFGQVSMTDRVVIVLCNVKGDFLLHLKRDVLINSAAAAAFASTSLT